MNAATSVTDLQRDIYTKYEDLSQRLQQVAKYVIEKPQSIAFDSVSEIARNADVPPSTLTRFAHAFHYRGFNDIKKVFRINLAEQTESYAPYARLVTGSNDDENTETPANILARLAKANISSLEDLNVQIEHDTLQVAVTLLNEANSIYVVGFGQSFGMASYLVYALRRIDQRVFLVDGLGAIYLQQMQTIHRGDVVVIISSEPYSDESVMVSEAVTEKNVKKIAITDSQVSPIATNSDACFVMKESQLEKYRTLSATQCLIQSLVVALIYNTNEETQVDALDI
ncbi:MurR/RpiR family transcriptional regulator [Vibrio sp. EA2]|uniref:MurR/RpiR family transcriptional regulator n=1 Tax=Vibrio sp. EA2 TaxID=3079860 RepID=UPI0029493783|nr:MurR/RpiR family transcriptional regulator [Vibrio sp. EA2]MDV6252840.1 MurR/RpiR family transcriptional regulator [Vibrio sp. EA2]